MKDQKKNNKGFSLVELIVVVAIMAVLLGVLVPTLVRNVEKSKKQKDINNLSEVRNAIQLAMATEDFAGVNGTITLTGTGFSIATDGSINAGGSAVTPSLTMTGTTKTQAEFFIEVLANLNGGAAYTFNYASKLAQPDTAVVFILADEKVSGYVEVKQGKYYTAGSDNKIQLQDQTAGSAAAGEGE